MALFNFGKKKEEENPKAYIKIIGSGCSRCRELEGNAKLALKELERNDSISHISDMSMLVKYGAQAVPALVINEELVSSGTILSVKAIKELLKDK